MSLTYLTNGCLFRRVQSIATRPYFSPQITRCLSTDEVKSTNRRSWRRGPGDRRTWAQKRDKLAWPVYGNDVTVNVERDEDCEDLPAQQVPGKKDTRVLDGTTVYQYKNGKRYAGHVKAGEYHGWGKMVYKNGNTYAGYWEDGKKHGRGKLYWKDKHKGGSEKDNCYTGYWKDNKEHGAGKQVFGNGDCFEGQFSQGQRWGRGKLTYADGTTLEGFFKENEIYNGKGVAVAKHGTRCIGEFKDGALCGPGKIVLKSGTTIVGEFVAGKVSGNCTVTYPDGGVYEGGWDDRPTGQGRLTLANGKVVQGVFKRGHLVDSTSMQGVPGMQQGVQRQDGKLVEVV